MNAAEEHIAEGWRIRYYRLLKGMLQKELAADCNFDKSFMCAIECGKNISRATVIKICSVLGIRRWQLAKFDSNWRQMIPKIKKMEKALRKKKREERKRKGLRG